MRNLSSATATSVENLFQKKATVLPLQAAGHLVISTEVNAETQPDSAFRGILCITAAENRSM